MDMAMDLLGKTRSFAVWFVRSEVGGRWNFREE